MIETHISSVIVQVTPEHSDAVHKTLSDMESVEVYYFTGGGKFVITIESTAEKFMSSVVETIQHLDGVLSTSMVYHHCDTPTSLEEEISV